MKQPVSGRLLLLACILAMLAMFLPLTVDGSIPIIPAISEYFDARQSDAQFSLSAAILGIATGQLVYGPLSDRFGRKPVILVGVLLYVLSSVACSAAFAIELLIATRFLQGCFACTGIIVARAIIRDLFDRETGAQLFSMMMSIHGVMPALAPGLCGWIGLTWGWQNVFLVMAAFGGFAFLAVLFGIRETHRHPDPKAVNPRIILRTYGQVLGNREFRAYVVCACFTYGGLFAYFAGAPIGLIVYLDLQPSEYGIAMAVPMICYIVTQAIVSRIVLRLGLILTLLTGIVLFLASGTGAVILVLTDSVSLYGFIFFVVVLLMALAFITPVTTVGAVSPFPQNAGAASSLLGFLQFLAASAVAAAVGIFSDGTPLPMAAAILLCALGAAVASRGVRRLEQKTTPP